MLTINADVLAGTTVASQPVQWTPSPNHNGIIRPRYLVFHYTGCSAEVARDTFLAAGGNKPVSAHLLVDRDGTVTQFVRFNERAWHAGVSAWGDLTDLNTYSIGIEVVNDGYLLRDADGEFRCDNGKPFDGGGLTTVVEAVHKNRAIPYHFWESFTATQIEVCEELAALLGRTYQLQDVLGHDDIAPGRKEDPGPAFPLARMRAAAVGRDDVNLPQGQFTYVGVPWLNIRTGPGTNFGLADKPLSLHTRLAVNGTADGWLHVTTDMPRVTQGWVWGAYTQATPV
ncbi:N-acetylmuramoyl-L-alanine amidase [Oxalobacteraceae bacterium OM1]|nr:N-acetylmuramoyl-L-alanine amidase [Oxalobacteraceae bacterium OM1]